ncbi:MAG: triple tyrosine motif-containing protein, partial [Fulvivirga sp.]|uniref:triple tyrosine motif-containing protein n=1 Tax=Fulvivirga sp. TaxID=1931237 RepID=UPI0032EDF3F5
MNIFKLLFSVLLLNLILLSFTIVGQKKTGVYPIKNFGPEEYQAGIQNIDFAQNRNMNLFVANNLGVLSYNGSKWETHAYRNGKKQRSLAFDQILNRLYVGSQGEFGYFEKNWEYTSLSKLISEESPDFDEVWDVFIFDSNVYFCTFQAIFVFDGTSINTITNEIGFNRSFSTRNRLYTQNQNGKLFEIDGLDLVPGIKQGQFNQIVSGIISVDQGNLIFYNSGEVELTNIVDVKTIYPELINALSGNYINHVTQLSDSRLSISTQRAGLFLYDLQSGVIENINASNGLQSNACLRSFQDHSGNLWVGMQNGLALLDINSPIRLIGKEINIQGSGYEAFQRPEGTYYTTSNGIYFLANGAAQCVFLAGTEGPSYSIKLINNYLYAGHHSGLFLLENGKALRTASTDGLWDIKRLQSNPNYALAGTYSGLYLFEITNEGKLNAKYKIRGFQESSRFFEEDINGAIWVGQFYKGLYKLDLNNDLSATSVERITSDNVPIEEHIVLSEINDELFLATKSGVYQINQDDNTISESKVFNAELENQWVYLLTQDKNKNVHVFSESRVGFYKQVSLNNYLFVPSSLFQLRHSFNNDLLNVSTHIEDGVYFNANEGFIYYNPLVENQITMDKKPVVSSIFSVDEDTLLFARLPFEDIVRTNSSIAFKEVKDIQFTVESFKFKNVDNQQFRYHLEGFDKVYSDWTFSPVKEYTNLPAGKYKFYVQTLNSLGERSTSEPLIITVKPPFLKTKWMKLIYGLLGITLIVLLYRFQRFRYKGKEK